MTSGRRRVMTAAVIALVLTFLFTLAPAVAEPTDARFKRFNELYKAGDYAAALVEAQKHEAEVKAQFGTNHADYARALHQLAITHNAQGRYDEADKLHKRALAIRERVLGTNHPAVAATLNNLAIVYRHQGKLGEAEGLHKRALAIREQKLGKSHPDVAAILDNLAVVYNEQGKYADAEKSSQAGAGDQEQAR